MGNYIHFCGGDRGGVGKSLFTKVLAGYYFSIEREITVFEADRANQDFAKIKGSDDGKIKIKRTLFSDNPELENDPDEILYEVLERKRDVVVNLPAGASLNLISWWNRCQGTEVCESNEITATNWFLTGGDNTHLINRSLDSFKIEHILVRNEYLRADWSLFFDFLDKESIEVPNILLMRLNRSLADFAGNNRLFLHDCINDERLRFLDRQRLKYFLSEMYEVLIKTGRVPLKD